MRAVKNTVRTGRTVVSAPVVLVLVIAPRLLVLYMLKAMYFVLFWALSSSVLITAYHCAKHGVVHAEI